MMATMSQIIAAGQRPRNRPITDGLDLTAQTSPDSGSVVGWSWRTSAKTAAYDLSAAVTVGLKGKCAVMICVLAFQGLAVSPAVACHHYKFWHFREPQRCGLAAPSPVQTPQDRSWYVEITDAAPSAPLETDIRTPDQIRDFDEHYIELSKHHDEINSLMVILHTEEDAARAAGLRE